MDTKNFVIENGLNPVDAIVLRKKVFGMVDHYAIYLGLNKLRRPEFAANFLDGVQVIPEKDIDKQLETYLPERIEKFEGSSIERENALQRAKSRIGEKSYGYISNNCEHFKNWVQFGIEYSNQVNKAGNLLTITGATLLTTGLISKKPKTRNWGLGLLAFGLILKGYAYKSKNS